MPISLILKTISFISPKQYIIFEGGGSIRSSVFLRNFKSHWVLPLPVAPEIIIVKGALNILF
ncbi:unnamed protein product [Meloidogyne enterolobii]|uniref:Uncharacterized protein n=1 Tax=Meloidogyne enterolobii TaxID=390850 RepID=A0ACB0XKE5_MELEN